MAVPFPLIAGGLGLYALSQRDKKNQQKSYKPQQTDVKSSSPSFLRDFARSLLLATPISPLVAANTNEAKEARKDQSGFFPELGLSEGYQAIAPSKSFVPAVTKAVLAPTGIPIFAGLFSKAAQNARKDHGGFFPELGLSEAIQASNPAYDYFNQSNSSNSSNWSEQAAKEKFIEETSNSPAQQSGAFTNDQLWQQKLKHEQWKRDQGRNYNKEFERFF